MVREILVFVLIISVEHQLQPGVVFFFFFSQQMDQNQRWILFFKEVEPIIYYLQISYIVYRLLASLKNTGLSDNSGPLSLLATIG